MTAPGIRRTQVFDAAFRTDTLTEIGSCDRRPLFCSQIFLIWNMTSSGSGPRFLDGGAHEDATVGPDRVFGRGSCRFCRYRDPFIAACDRLESRLRPDRAADPSAGPRAARGNPDQS